MTRVRLLLDEHVSLPAYRQLLADGIDVKHVLEIGMKSASDPEVLRRACDEGRVLVTRNYPDFAPLVVEWLRTETRFPGVLFLSNSIRQADVGAHVRAVREWLAGPAAKENPVEGTYGWLT